MVFSTTGYRHLAGGVLLSLSLPFVMQDAVAQGSAQVLTPFGYRDSANVNHVPKGYELMSMPDEHIRMQNPTTGDHIDFPKPVVTNAQRAPLPDNGWITYASWYNTGRSPIAYFATQWTVPAYPSTYDGQTLFQFNSIEPASGQAILQPVLQYGPSRAGGGEYWSIASWFLIGNQVYFTDLTYVTPGTPLGGVITLIGRQKRKFSYSCDFYGYSGTNLTVQGIPQLKWATETLEVYSVDACSEFPNTAYSQMHGITIYLNNGTIPPVNWTVTNVATDCGVQTTVGTNGAEGDGEVNIYY